MIDKNLHLLEMVFNDYPSLFDFRLWEGTVWKPPRMKEKRATVVINNPYILAEALSFPVDLRLGEAYVYKDIDVEGDIFAIFPAEKHIAKKYRKLITNPAFWKTIWDIKKQAKKARKSTIQGKRFAELKGKMHSLERDREAIRYHYNLPPEFYALYLDPLMNYSCAYFRNGSEDLATAQLNKLELICRKIRLKEGDRVLDVGCGWGGFVIYAAKNYRAKVLGITLAENQMRFANERIKKEGLEGLAEVKLLDYREVEGKFDKIVSIGMFEHVGEKMLKVYFQKAYDLLKPNGIFLNHGIAAKWSFFRRHFRRYSFVEKYVFPDGDLLPINHTLKVAEEAGFEVRDVESLREHYALTLRKWVENLAKNKEEALRIVDEPTYRVWYLYMAGASYGFSINQQSVFQTLLVKNDGNGKNTLPLSREDIYKEFIMEHTCKAA